MIDVHYAFADFFEEKLIRPYAYLVSKKLSEGHVCLNLTDIDSSVDFKNTPFENATTSVEDLKQSSFVSDGNNAPKPFVLEGNLLYLNRYFFYETQIIEKIKSFIETEKKYQDSRVNFLNDNTEFIERLNADLTSPSEENVENIDWQLVGTLKGYLNNFTIITGGPGTGKTTTVAKILALLYKENPEIRVALAAPTGKAGVRMKESLKGNKDVDNFEIRPLVEALESSTIHRLLGFKMHSPYFKHNEQNHLLYDVVIVDEASMIDVALFAKLLVAINPSSRLILLGDKDQLASVEAGSLLGDLAKSLETLNGFTKESISYINAFIKDNKAQITSTFEVNEGALLFEHIVELKKSHRFKSNGGIGQLSKAVIAGAVQQLKHFYKNTDKQVRIDETYDVELFEEFIEGYADYLNLEIKPALIAINKLKVLCAVRKGTYGVEKINEKIEKYLISKRLIKVEHEFYHNRPILVTKNSKELNLYNGDIGIIRKDASGSIKAYFLDDNNEVREVLPGYISDFETVFAMTIHKSQGSEYDNVMVVLPKNTESALLTRELLYTAITRAKQKVFIQGSKEVLENTTNRAVERASGIHKRIK